MSIYMYLLFDISSAQSPSLSFSLLLSLSLSLCMSFISQRSLIFPYLDIAPALPTFVTLSLILFSGFFFKLFILVSIFLDMWISIFLIFSDTIILSIFMFGCFYFSRFFYLRCCHLIASLPLSLFWCLSHSLCSCTSLISLLPFSISCSISLLLSL